MGDKVRWNAGCKAKIVFDSKYIELHRKEEYEVCGKTASDRDKAGKDDDSKQSEL